MTAIVRLNQLEPHFLKIISDTRFKEIDDFSKADGLEFLCPLCWMKNGGARGTHYVICWRPHVPQTIHPVPGRWEFKGRGYGDLTLVAGSSSVLLKGGCEAHFFIQNGMVSFA